MKKHFCVCVCIKWLILTKFGKETYENNNTEVTVDGIGKLWLNEKHIEEQLGHTNLPVITNKYDQVYQKHRHELANKPKKQPSRRFYIVIWH